MVYGIKEGLQRDNILFLIDQESGGVARLRLSHFRATLSFAHFGSLVQQDFSSPLVIATDLGKARKYHVMSSWLGT